MELPHWMKLPHWTELPHWIQLPFNQSHQGLQRLPEDQECLRDQ